MQLAGELLSEARAFEVSPKHRTLPDPMCNDHLSGESLIGPGTEELADFSGVAGRKQCVEHAGPVSQLAPVLERYRHVVVVPQTSDEDSG